MATRRAATTAPADLRQRILQTSQVLLDSEGVAALSMREVARRAGVTHQAPYHHFADRESILAELVTQGFDELSARLARANDLAAKQGRHAALRASCRAYVGFALDRPGVFRIMFRPDLCDATRFPLAMAAGARAKEELNRLVRLMHGGRHSEALANTYWAQVHGLAGLLVDGPIGQHLPGRAERLAHLDEVADQFAGFTLGTDDDAPTRARAKSAPLHSTRSKGE